MLARAPLLAIVCTSTAAVASPVVDDALPESPSSLDDDIARQSRTRVFDFDGVVIGDADTAPSIELVLGLEVGDIDLLRSPPTNPRIIDIELMHRRDCVLDRIRGGQCVLRGFDEPVDAGIDVERYGRDRAQHGRVLLLDRIRDTADDL